MSQVTKMLPGFFPKVKIVAEVSAGRRHTVGSLCELAGIECRVTGSSTERVVFLRDAASLDTYREPGPMGSVSIEIPKGDERKRAILALGVLAYSVFDYAARESMRGRPESRTSPPLGRPKKTRTLSGAERTRRWRQHREDLEDVRIAGKSLAEIFAGGICLSQEDAEKRYSGSRAQPNV